MPQARAGTARPARGLASATGHAGSLLRELTCEVESGGIRVGGGDRAASFEVSPLTPSAPLAPSPFLDRCGSCGDTVDMGKDDMVRCRSCGHRILYKTRLKRAVQYEAR